MRLNKLCMACTAALLLTGCAIGPDYVQPYLNMPMDYRTISGEALQNTEWLNAQWWKEYGDEGLDTLISCALANNRTLQQTMANVEKAAAAVTVTRSALFPQLGYTLQIERDKLSQNTYSGEALHGVPYNTRGVLASASWEIDLWGKIRRQTEAAEATLGAYEAAHKAAISSVIGSVISNYLSILMTDEQLRIAQETAKSYYDTYKLFLVRAEHGNVSDLEVAQAKSEWENAKVQIPTIKQERTEYVNALAVLTGVDPGDMPKFRTLSSLKVPVIGKGLPSDLLFQRPDIVEAEEELIAANADIGAARALYFPTIQITGDYGFSSAKLRHLFKAHSQVWDYVGTITGPIFQWGAIRAENREADADYMAMLASYKLTVADAFADVDNSLSRRQNLVQEMKDKISLVQSLREYKRLAYAQYEEGYTSYTTVLQAEQSLLPQELDLATVRANALLSVAQIYMALGGGWIDVALHQEQSSILALEEAENARKQAAKDRERAMAMGQPIPIEEVPPNEPMVAEMVSTEQLPSNTVIMAPNSTGSYAMQPSGSVPAKAIPVPGIRESTIIDTPQNMAGQPSNAIKMIDAAEAKPNRVVEAAGIDGNTSSGPAYAPPPTATTTPTKPKLNSNGAKLINAVK